jgi:hypothetical protein
MMTAYLVICLLFALPVAAKLFADLFLPGAEATAWLRESLFVSPFAAAFSMPLHVESGREMIAPATQLGAWSPTTAPVFLVYYLLVDLLLLGLIMWLFKVRWRVAY